MVDVEHGALGAFEEDGLTFIESAIGEFGCVADKTFNFFAEREGGFDFAGEINLGAVGSLGNAIFFGDDASGFFAEERRIEKISDTQAAASHFIFVGRTNAAGGSANGVGATRGFGGFIEFAVIRENEMSAIRDVEAALYVDATLGEGFNFGDEGGGIDDNAGANDGVPLRAENAAGDELENETIFANDDGVTGVVAASNSNDVIEGAC